MAAPLLAAAAPAAIAAVGSALGQRSANKANAKEAEKNRGFQERMRNTQWQAGVADMRAAGLNPALAYSQGPASSPSGSLAAPMQDSIGKGVSSAMATLQARKQMRILDANAREAEANATDRENTVGTLWAQNKLNGRTYPSWGATNIMNGMQLTQAQREQAQNLARISGLGSNLAGNMNPALSAIGSQAGRGLTSITSMLRGMENLNSKKDGFLAQGLFDTYNAGRRFFNRFKR